MVFIGCTDKVVIVCVHQIPDSLYFASHFIYILLWCDACGFCLFLNLLTVFVCSGLEVYVIALCFFVSCNGVCKYDFIGVSNVRFA